MQTVLSDDTERKVQKAENHYFIYSCHVYDVTQTVLVKKSQQLKPFEKT